MDAYLIEIVGKVGPFYARINGEGKIEVPGVTGPSAYITEFGARAAADRASEYASKLPHHEKRELPFPPFFRFRIVPFSVPLRKVTVQATPAMRSA